MRQEDLVKVAELVDECLDKVLLQQLANVLMARHLISPMWLETCNLMMMKAL